MPFFGPAALRSMQVQLDRSLPEVYVTHYPLEGRNQSDEPVWSPIGTSYRAWIRFASGIISDATGDELAYETEVLLGADAPRISRDDKLVLPDGTEPPILRVEWYPPEEAPYFQYVFLGITE